MANPASFTFLSQKSFFTFHYDKIFVALICLAASRAGQGETLIFHPDKQLNLILGQINV